ncbi:cuticle-degrading serine protease [Drechslerella stenobrocha 248]|uniref:Cuticle-degrading serine protease n=2 Tax=Drechslerella stenobrocha TaxID=314127 RepID=W7HL19_9PEZI|nr:cuticle-degrading serine protease [Drechslerella stenobrocha]EWC43724.1 cuticle-degrading serine protease [Drechslerella stenobrocha 248]
MLNKALLSLLAAAGLATNVLAGPIHRVSNAGQAGTIADKYIVVLKKDLSDSAVAAHTSRISSYHGNVARDLTGARSRGVERDFHFSNTGFKGYCGGFDKATLQQILRSPEVEYVEQDAVMTTFAKQTESIWGLHRISNEKMSKPYTYNYNNNMAGKNTFVYVIDTGVHISHEEFQREDGTGASRAVWGTNTVDKVDRDGNGHGTHCAGTIAGRSYGVARNATIVAVKVLNASGSGSTSGVIAGMNWVTENVVLEKRENLAVASMSLGGSKSAAINEAANKMADVGITVVAAAGNSNIDMANTSPASASGVIAVGATDSDNKKASFSNWGKDIAVFAPGVDIYSAWSGSNTEYKTISGTSMACPHVAGLVAYYMSQFTSGLAPKNARDTITTTALVDQINFTEPRKTGPNRIAYNSYKVNQEAPEAPEVPETPGNETPDEE